MSSRNLAWVLLNWAKKSLLSGGQLRMPVTTPVYSVPFGPSTTAPFRTGAEPSSEPAMLAT